MGEPSSMMPAVGAIAATCGYIEIPTRALFAVQPCRHQTDDGRRLIKSRVAVTSDFQPNAYFNGSDECEMN